MFIRRCPYCGEVITFAKKTKATVLDSYFFSKCPHCKQRYNYQYPRKLCAVIPVVIYFILLWGTELLANKTVNVVLFVISLLLYLLLLEFIPLARWDYGELITMYSVNYEVKCNIVWNKPWHILRYFVYSGFITPVIFYKDGNEQISDAWCGVFRKIRHIGSKTKCEFEFVVDTAPKELLKVGNQFKIFYKEKQIGEGVIKKLDY